ncbi:hypothetical protein [Pseudoruegeria sp. SHC-113]|uniref:hypothetical protein n=1 Tax=Pseudoruegeria sp. SHC-113 TaxID=2855439 RepID=UPI0021BA5866|nr:hypothetical protein [Pseudoruegeria sp. SHC-113]MCT8160525.1 hypothetical protein [Pseudoruegeria sp. SHC-113]
MKSESQTHQIRLGHPSRLRDEHGLRVTVLVLGLFIVFVLLLAHDEIARDMVLRGMIAPGQEELAELGIGAVLFVFWGALTVGIIRLLSRVYRGGKG